MSKTTTAILTDLEMSELIYRKLGGDQQHKNYVMADWYSATFGFLDSSKNDEEMLNKVNRWMKKNKLPIEVSNFIKIEDEGDIEWQVDVTHSS